MTIDAAEALLRANGSDMCARFYRRPDGTVLTSDCPVGARRRRRRRLVVTAVAAAAGVLGVAWMLAERSGEGLGAGRSPGEVRGVGELSRPAVEVEVEFEPRQGGISMPETGRLVSPNR